MISGLNEFSNLTNGQSKVQFYTEEALDLSNGSEMARIYEVYISLSEGLRSNLMIFFLIPFLFQINGVNDGTAHAKIITQTVENSKDETQEQQQQRNDTATNVATINDTAMKVLIESYRVLCESNGANSETLF